MKEKEIIRAINTIADNYEQGCATDSKIVSNELRDALSRLYRVAYNTGFKDAKNVYEHSDEIAIKVAKERIERECRQEYEARIELMNQESCEKLNALEKQYGKVVALLRQTLEQIETEASQEQRRSSFGYRF